MPEVEPRRVPRVDHVWATLVLAAAFVAPSVGSLFIVDLGWTLRAGQVMLETGRLLQADPFTSAPPAEPQMNVQWLAQLATYGLYALGGFDLLAAANALAAAATLGLVLAAGHALSGRLRLASAVAALALVLGASNLGARPQTLAYPLFGVFLLAWARQAAGQRTRLWLALPPLMAVWANVHGSFFLGLALVGAASFDRLRMILRQAEDERKGFGMSGRGKALLAAGDLLGARAPLAALAACVLAAGVTPYGAGSVLYVLRLGGNPIVRDFLGEWAPTSTATREGALFFLSVALLAGVLWWTRVRPTPGEWLLLAVFGALGLASLRAVVWWGLVAAPIGARWVARRLGPPVPPRAGLPRANAALIAALVGVAALSLPVFRPLYPFLPPERRALLSPDNPARVAAYLRERGAVPDQADWLFNESVWGGYLDWTVWPRYRPFLDTRVELHPPAVWLDYLYTTYPGADWQAMLDRYDARLLVLDTARNGDLIAVVDRSPDWRRAYADDQAVVFERAVRAGDSSPSAPNR